MKKIEVKPLKYTSTRDSSLAVDSAQAIVEGISRDGGLFVPTEIPKLTEKDLADLAGMEYADRARWVLSRFLTDWTEEELADCVQGAYGSGRFQDDNPAPLSCLDEEGCLLELWHGPTCAFKDVALQMLPRLMPLAARKCGCKEEIAILTATSGDTGKAALEGFQDVPGTRILVFYPEDGVSRMQKRQMLTQAGNNVSVIGIRGNFDVAYYVSAYCDLLSAGKLQNGELVNFCVPTGNFGNILAGYYAKQMGLPVKMFICASNRNNVLTDFIHTGRYDRNRKFYTTTSPSMDILISSNLERLLYLLTGRSDRETREKMEELKTSGTYQLTGEELAALQKEFFGACCDDEEASGTIRRIFETYSYLCDPHTAVAVNAWEQYREQTGDRTRTVILSTASPYKFADTVLTALGEECPEDDFRRLECLERVSGLPAPEGLTELERKEVRFREVCSPEEMEDRVREFLRKK